MRAGSDDESVGFLESLQTRVGRFKLVTSARAITGSLLQGAQFRIDLFQWYHSDTGSMSPGFIMSSESSLYRTCSAELRPCVSPPGLGKGSGKVGIIKVEKFYKKCIHTMYNHMRYHICFFNYLIGGSSWLTLAGSVSAHKAVQFFFENLRVTQIDLF